MSEPTPPMLYTLNQIGESTCTGFGYNNNNELNSKRYLNTNTVHALIKRGLLEPAGEMAWNTYVSEEIGWKGRTTPIFRLSESGKQTLKDNQPPIMPKDETWKQVFARGN